MTGPRPPASGGPMFSRDELLAGLPARRASTVLYAIEAHTARIMASSRVQRATFVSRRGAAEREQAFLEALAAGRDLPLRPSIQDLERFAPQWRHLVPEGVEARAALAVQLAARYRFTADRIPRIREALALDTPQVAAAVARQAPEKQLYAAALTLGERIAWRRAALAQRIEALPPFWIAYALALTETITEGILIVPIAVAGIGPIAGVVVLLILGAINLITIGAQAEAITRNGSMRYGSAYFGRLVEELLGRAGSIGLSVALAVFNAVVLLAYLLGFASVLRGATGIPEEAWVLLLFAINAWVLRRETLDETVATAVILGAVNIGLILAITGIAFANLEPANLVQGAGFEPIALQLVFGVIIVSYFGHTSAANASKLILGQDASGRALLWGNLAAIGTVIGLYSLIVVAFAGALGTEPLDGARGTAITPLAEKVGPIVDVLGSIYVVLAVGLGSLYCSLGLYNQVIEHLPARGSRDGGFLATKMGRYLAGLAPTLITAAVLEYLLLTGQDWFARPVALIGVLTIPLLGGIIPMLLLVAARRRGEYVPASVIGFFGHPVAVTLVSVVFLVAIVLHGTVIWEDPIERAAALVVAVLTVALVAWIVRGQAFRRAIAIEIRDAQRGASMEPAMSVVVGGRSRRTRIEIERHDGTTTVHEAGTPVGLGGLRRATFELADHAAHELKVWAHRVTAHGDSIGLRTSVEVHDRDQHPRAVMSGTGQLVTEIDREPLRVAVTFEPAD